MIFTTLFSRLLIHSYHLFYSWFLLVHFYFSYCIFQLCLIFLSIFSLWNFSLCSSKLLSSLSIFVVIFWLFPGGSDDKKNLPTVKVIFQSLGWEDSLKKGMVTHSSILAWRIPRTEKSGGLQSVGSERVRRDWATNTFTFIFWTLYWIDCLSPFKFNSFSEVFSHPLVWIIIFFWSFYELSVFISVHLVTWLRFLILQKQP